MPDNKNFKDDLNDFIGDAKEKAREFTEEAKASASEFTESAKNTFSSQDSKKILAGILAILFGYLGVHKFILGYKKEGFIIASISFIGVILSCVGIGVLLLWVTALTGIIEGVIYLTMSDKKFFKTYQAQKKPWF